VEDQQQQSGGGGLKQIAGELISAGPAVVMELIQELSQQLADQNVDFGQLVAEAMGGEGGGQEQQGMPQEQAMPMPQGDPAGGGLDPAAAAMEAEMMAAAMAGDQRKGRVTLR
jgi:hypothetical protein